MNPPLPEKFVSRVLSDLGECEGRRLTEALEGEPPVTVRTNPCKYDGGLAGEPIGWSSHGLRLDARPRFTFEPAFHAGCYYVQEAGSQFVEHILHATGTGEGRILDMCAAPGGKTTLYSSLAGMDGLVVANEPVSKRTAVLADNVRKWGMGNVVVTCDVPQSFARLGEYFDVVAVDAPCSGEGMFRKEPQARTEWSEQSVSLCAARQSEILEEAWRTLKHGGVLIYSTCTFNRTENEELLMRFCAEHGDEVAEAPAVGCQPEWGVVTGRAGVFQTFRFYPHRALGEGFFAAVACKRSDGRNALPSQQRRGRVKMTETGRAETAELSRWVAEPQKMRFVSIDGDIYALRRSQFEAVRMISERVNVVYSGVGMGRLFGGRLKPEHPLAMYCGLNRSAVPAAAVGREQAVEYLSKRDIDVAPLSEGLNLVVCDGCALGFAKRIGRRCNNGYPNSLRILKRITE